MLRIRAISKARTGHPSAYLLSEDSPRLDAAARAWIKKTRFSFDSGTFTYFTQDHRIILLFSTGPRAEWSHRQARKLGGKLAVECRRLGIASIDVHLDDPNISPSHARALTTGLVEGTYRIREDKSGISLEEIFLIPRTGSLADVEKEIARGAAVGHAINEIRDIANRPGNLAPPRVIASEARALARRTGLTCTVWDRKRLEAERCRALLAVAAGSREAPCLIHLRYPGRNRNLRPLVVIGKTITFDTGGISLKPGKNMEWMKFDKSGGMTVLAFMALVGSILKPERPVIGMLAAAENMPGDAATRPGDVVTARSGKTIEIVNTDAEGRLVLADALDVAREYQPAAIIDLATLTGAANVALGRPYSAILSNHAPLRESLQAAGETSGDRVWPLPLHPDYRSLLKSPFADLKNIGDGSAGTIVGGTFLEAFVPAEIPWAHIDLTSAWEERATGHGPAGATLFGAALLAQWIDQGGMEAIGR